MMNDLSSLMGFQYDLMITRKWLTFWAIPYMGALIVRVDSMKETAVAAVMSFRKMAKAELMTEI